MRSEVETEEDSRFIAEVPSIPGAMVYGKTAKEAVQKVKDLANRILEEGGHTVTDEEVQARINQSENPFRERTARA